MITKNSKDIIAILRWLQSNACTIADERPHMEKVHIIRDTDSITLETTNGFTHTRVQITGLDKCPIDLPEGDGLYTMTFLSKETVEWEEWVGIAFPDVAALYPLSPMFELPKSDIELKPSEKFSTVCCVDPSRMAKFMPAFLQSVRLCLNGTMLGIFGYCDIDNDQHSIHVTGLLMPMHPQPDDHTFDKQSTKVKYERWNGSWLEIHTEVSIPESSEIPNSELEPEMDPEAEVVV
jgi:hypothetical protein